MNQLRFSKIEVVQIKISPNQNHSRYCYRRYFSQLCSPIPVQPSMSLLQMDLHHYSINRSVLISKYIIWPRNLEQCKKESKSGKWSSRIFFLAVEIHVSRLLVPRPIYVAALAALAALPSTDLGAFIM